MWFESNAYDDLYDCFSDEKPLWFVSKLYEDLKEQDKETTLYDCLSEHSLKEYLDDFINLNITKDNYLKLIELCDFLMVEDSDILVNKIIHRFGFPIIHNFGDFYKYNCRLLKVHNRKSLKEAIQSYCQNRKKCYETYGFSAYWNVSNITNMNNMFHNSEFNGDISRWDVSKVTTMNSMFRNSHFNGDISQWNVSNVETMICMFASGKFNGNISKWNVSNVNFMESMFENTPFNGDLSKWKVSSLQNKDDMFKNCPFDDSKLKWKLINH